MRAISFYKLAGRDEVICDACLEQTPHALDGGVPLYPHHFPGVYRVLACCRCGASCRCATETCGSPGCHRLRSARLDRAAHLRRQTVPAGTETAFSFEVTGQGRFRF